MNSLTNQVAIVTGGGRGIGRAMARTLAGAGAQVAVVARSRNELEETVSEISAGGGRATAFPADVADADAIRSAIEEIERRMGPVDFLVNNAGILGPLRPLADSDPAAWWRGMEVNVRGPMLATHAVLPGMIARRRGRIVNVSSAGARPHPRIFRATLQVRPH